MERLYVTSYIWFQLSALRERNERVTLQFDAVTGSMKEREGERERKTCDRVAELDRK